MRLLKQTTLDHHLFRWYGLTTLAIISILGITPVVMVSNTVNREIKSSLENSARSIAQIVEYGARQEIRYRLQQESEAAAAKIRDIYLRNREAGLPATLAQREAREWILERRIGTEGYFYVIDSTGTVVSHPFESLEGTGQTEFSFIRQQIDAKEGFLEYLWKNPGEAIPRKKALGMSYFPEWDWIITAAAYRTDFPELFDITTLSDYIDSLRTDDRAYSFVLDSDWTFLIHPFRRGVRLSTDDGSTGNRMREKIASDSSGFFTYAWHPDGEAEWENKLLYFLRISDFGWTVASTVYLDDVRAPTRHLALTIILLGIGNLLLFLFLSTRFSRTVTAPLERLIEGLNQGELGDYGFRAEACRIEELDSLGHHLNNFMRRLDKSKLDKEDLDTLRLLSETVFENTIEGIAITDLEGTIQSINQAFCDITGFSRSEAVGQNPRFLKSGHHSPEFYTDMWDRLKASGNWSGEIWNRRKNGEAFPEWLTITSLRDEAGAAFSYISIFHDISDQKQTERQLKYQAYHDALTGLPNRELFKDRLDVALATSARTGEHGAVIFLDLDNFKQVNDSQGHQIGDQYLKEIATRLRLSIREVDTVARMGGDEFTILLPKIGSRSMVIDIVERIINAFGEPVSLGTKTIHPRASFGITFYPDDGRDTGRLMRNADMAMYRTKNRGDGSYTLFNERIEQSSRRRTDLEERLRRAVVDGHLQVYYQPQYTLESGSFTGVEALIRWNDPEEGWISPTEFIPIAERSGLISPIDTWLLRRALREIRNLNRTLPEPIELSVNVSAVQFKEEEFVESITAALVEAEYPPELLTLEITESTAMINIAAALQKMEGFTEIGVRIAVDDFGTGYSSLSYLNRLKASILKIDRSFVQSMNESPEAAAIATSIISLGNSLGLQVVAEGVENNDQFEFLRRQACPIIQGFLFARPMPVNELEAFLNHEAGS